MFCPNAVSDLGLGKCENLHHEIMKEHVLSCMTSDHTQEEGLAGVDAIVKSSSIEVSPTCAVSQAVYPENGTNLNLKVEGT